MSENTPSQAEGEAAPPAGADDEPERSGRPEAPRTTPSQAEGDDDNENNENNENGDGDAEWEAGWSGP
ncbi:hypothetical protein [Streptomyces sp. NPDC053367]|uniref:hypothetical protein n=1 Tax=Streptomyces sp. NPDC053367 TaxID=3365700 RepID=UPI0037D70A9E